MEQQTPEVITRDPSDKDFLKEAVFLSDLSPGEVFQDNAGNYYLKPDKDSLDPEIQKKMKAGYSSNFDVMIPLVAGSSVTTYSRGHYKMVVKLADPDTLPQEIKRLAAVYISGGMCGS
jgi:hypothetical protein